MTHKTRWIAAAGGLLAVAIPVAPAHAVQFSRPSFVSDLRSPSSFAYADFDRDGRLDLATASADGVLVRRNETPLRSGTPSFPSERTTVFDMGGSGRPNVVVARDLNEDGRPDLVAANSAGPTGSAVTVRRNITAPGGPIAFAQVEATPAHRGVVADELALVELNDDGLVDIAYADGVTGAVHVMRNESRQEGPTARTDFGAPVTAQAASADAVVDLAVAQVDNQLNPELVVARTSGNLSIFINQSANGGELRFAPSPLTEDTTVRPLAGIAAADIDKDERQDVVAAGGALTQGGFVVLRNMTSSTALPDLVAQPPVATGRGMTDVVVTNIDEDGDDTDLVGSRDDGFATVALNAGGLNYPAAGTTDHDAGGSRGTSQVFVGELNGDSDLDVSVLDPGANRVSVALQSPDVRTTPTGLVEYVEDTPPVAVDPSLTVFAPGGTTELQGAAVRITTGAAGDELAMPARDDITAAYDRGSRTLVLSGAAPVKAYEAALRSVVFSAPGDDPQAGSRRFVFTVRSDVSSPDAARSGRVTAVNDAARALLSGPSGLLPPARQSVQLDPAMDVADPDSGTLSRAVFRIARGYDRPNDRLDMPPRDGFTPAFNSEAGTLTLTGSRSLAEWRDVLRTVTFSTVGSSRDARAIDVRLTDSQGLEGPPSTRTLAVPGQTAAPAGSPSGAVSGATVAGRTGARQARAFGSTPPAAFGIDARGLRDGRIRLTVSAPRAGRLDVSRLVSRRRTQLPATREAVRAGTTTITLRPTAAVRRLVHSRGRHVLNLRVAYRPQRAAVVRRIVRVVVRRVVVSRAQALRDGRVRLTVRAPYAGRLSVGRVRSGRTTALGARTVRLRRGTTRVTLQPTRAARSLVRRDGRLRLTLRVTYRPTRRAASRESVVVTLRRR